jgi:hypothetical protein
MLKKFPINNMIDTYIGKNDTTIARKGITGAGLNNQPLHADKIGSRRI